VVQASTQNPGVYPKFPVHLVDAGMDHTEECNQNEFTY